MSPAAVKGQRAPPAGALGSHASREPYAGDQALPFVSVSVHHPASGSESRLPGACPQTAPLADSKSRSSDSPSLVGSYNKLAFGGTAVTASLGNITRSPGPDAAWGCEAAPSRRAVPPAPHRLGPWSCSAVTFGARGTRHPGHSFESRASGMTSLTLPARVTSIPGDALHAHGARDACVTWLPSVSRQTCQEGEGR